MFDSQQLKKNLIVDRSADDMPRRIGRMVFDAAMIDFYR